MACDVLVVEDDADLRQMMAELFALEGLAVLVATNGRDALDVLREGKRPKVILLDLMMPVMDGWQFRREQCADPGLAAIPVVVATAAPINRTRELNAAVVLQKPLDFDVTIAAVRRLC